MHRKPYLWGWAKSKGSLILEWNPEIKQQGGFWKASVDCNLIIGIFNCYYSQAWLLHWKLLVFFCVWVGWQLLELLCHIIIGKSPVYMVAWSQRLHCLKTCGRAVQKTALEYPTAENLTLCLHCLVCDFAVLFIVLKNLFEKSRKAFVLVIW